ncbi:MAG TPA: calcium-binding protein [Noviherbaspirillum sp.]|nr:calcium-binding protein [Noviherbaspirillum sp.]
MATIIKGTRLGNKLDGTSGADEIYGYEGNDQLNGGLGDDLLDGGTGSDTLLGGAGSDVYVFTAGSGRDTIRETINGTDIDVIRFTDLRPSHVRRLDRDGADLTIQMVTGDEIRIAGHYAGYSIEQIQFSDGTVWYGPDLNKVMRAFNGTMGNDFIVGTSGIDLIDGKAGDDMLQGGTGGDTYIFASGSGRDTIVETVNAGETDIIRFTTATPEQVSLLRKGADLLIRVSTGEEVRVAGQFAGNGIEKIEFGSGIAWGAKEINSAPNEIIGSASSDYLIGTAGTDLIHGAGGDDMLQGGEGSDTYFFKAGDGRGTVREAVNAGEVDTLRFTSYVAPENVSMLRQGADLLIRLSSGDEVRVAGQFAGNGIEKIEFGNGMVWGANEINNVPAEIFGTDSNDYLVGGAGNDLIHGMGGDDVLMGGEGSDTYSFNLSGHDTIRETVNAGETDTLLFTHASPEHVTLLRQGADLEVRMFNGDGVRIVGQYTGSGIEKIEFGNGVVWGAAEINNAPSELFGTQNADFLFGSAGTDLIHGFAGDDMLQGGEGSDVYFFVPGDGRDTIRETFNASDIDTLRLGYGVTPENTSLLRQELDLVIRLFNGDEVRVAGQYPAGGIEKIEFGNGVVWGTSEINNVPSAILGTENADFLFGSPGVDLIQGMGGDDMLQGGEGGDTYFFSYGDGRDTIRETWNAGETDTIHFNSAVTPENARLFRQGPDLLIRLYTGEEVRVAGQYAGNGIEKIEFGNGVVWGTSEINNLPAEIFGTDGNDYLVGHPGTDLMHGMGGDDVLMGGEGSDTYFFNLSGHDTIHETMNAGETDTLHFTHAWPEHVTLHRHGADLEVRMFNGDGVRIVGQYGGSGIEKIEFGNGVVWGATEINNASAEIVGTGNADFLIGFAGADRISGMGGDDTLMGTAGGDTYVFNPGDGRDTIVEEMTTGDVDRISFAYGITPDGVTLVRSGGDLLVRLWTGDEVRVNGQYYGAGIEEITFSNGVVWGADRINGASEPVTIQPVGVAPMTAAEYPLAA